MLSNCLKIHTYFAMKAVKLFMPNDSYSKLNFYVKKKNMGSGKIFSSLKYGCCLLVVEVALKLSHSLFLKSTCMCIVINHDSIPVVID